MKSSAKQLRLTREHYARWVKRYPKEHKKYKIKIKEYMKPFRIKVPKGYVQTKFALQILSIPYAKKSRLHYIKKFLDYKILNDKIGRGHIRGRYFWNVKSLIAYRMLKALGSMK